MSPCHKIYLKIMKCRTDLLSSALFASYFQLFWLHENHISQFPCDHKDRCLLCEESKSMEVTDSRRLEFNFNTQHSNLGMRPKF